jgi:hypothetical protein
VLGTTVRTTIPSASSSFSRSEIRRSLMPGMAALTSLKRVAPWIMARMMTPLQRRPISSMAWW